jgi:hypothetical protein
VTRMKRIIIGAAGATAVLGALTAGAVAYADEAEPATPSFVTVEDDGTGTFQRGAQPGEGDDRNCPDKDGGGAPESSPAPQSPPAGEL